MLEIVVAKNSQSNLKNNKYFQKIANDFSGLYLLLGRRMIPVPNTNKVKNFFGIFGLNVNEAVFDYDMQNKALPLNDQLRESRLYLDPRKVLSTEPSLNELPVLVLGDDLLYIDKHDEFMSLKKVYRRNQLNKLSLVQRPFSLS